MTYTTFPATFPAGPHTLCQRNGERIGRETASVAGRYGFRRGQCTPYDQVAAGIIIGKEGISNLTPSGSIAGRECNRRRVPDVTYTGTFRCS